MISLETHPMDCVYDLPATAGLFSVLLLKFCLWMFFLLSFLNVFRVILFFFIDLRCDMTSAIEMNGRSSIEPEFLKVFPILISTTAQMHIFSTVISHQNACLCINLKEKAVIFFFNPPAFCFKYLIMCNQNPSEPWSVTTFNINYVLLWRGADQACLYRIFLKNREWVLFLKCVYSVKGSLQLLKTWLTLWDGIISISACFSLDFDTRLFKVIGFSVKERTSLTSMAEQNQFASWRPFSSTY